MNDISSIDMNEDYVVVGCKTCNSNKGAIYIYKDKFVREFVIEGESASNQIGDNLKLQSDDLADSTRLWYTKGLNVTYANLVKSEGTLHLVITEYG